MSKKATIILEGNEMRIERTIHELSKIVDEVNKQPELTASIQTESIEPTDCSGFEPATEQ